MEFRNWLYLELENPFASETDDVVFRPYINREGERGYRSDFTSEDGNHSVFFTIKNRDKFPNLICYDINLSNPQGGYSLTNRSRNPNLVYSKLLKIIVEFVNRNKPPLLSFLASDPNMEPIYKRFYDRYMKDMYPMVDYGLFMRKDLYEKMKPSVKGQQAYQSWEMASGEAKESKRKIQKFNKMLPELNDKFIKHYVQIDPLKIAHTGMFDKDLPSKLFPILPTKIKTEDEFIVLNFYFINKKRKLDFAKVYLTIEQFPHAFKNASEKQKLAFTKLKALDQHRISKHGLTQNFKVGNINALMGAIQ